MKHSWLSFEQFARLLKLLYQFGYGEAGVHVVNAFTGCRDEAKINAGTCSKPERHSKLQISIMEMLGFDYFYFASKVVNLLIFQNLNTCHLGRTSFCENKHDCVLFSCSQAVILENLMFRKQFCRGRRPETNLKLWHWW